MRAHNRQEVKLLTDPSWGFDDDGPGYYLSFDGTYARKEKVDPAPCYAHDVEAVRAELAHLQCVAPVPVPLGIFVLSHEMRGRTNAWCSEDRVYPNGGGHADSYPVGIIAMSGKRIPVHPAMTRYLVAHEYGHFVEQFLARARGLKDGLRLRQYYREHCRPEGSEAYGCGKWHQATGEIFANDFRILIAKREAEFWPHPGVPRPEENLAVIGFWAKVREEFWTAEQTYVITSMKAEPAA
jgi:hypothetical protein